MTMLTVAEIEEHSAYIVMRDGVRIAVQTLLPPSRAPLATVPAVVIMTRYGRATKYLLTSLDYSDQLQFINNGFAVVSVDVRGSGASFGNRAGFDAAQEILNWEELLDTSEIFDWIIAQPWSDGSVFTTGVSYPGNTSELAQAVNHPALRAVAPRFTDFDLYNFLLFPGGAADIAFNRPWGALTGRLDRGHHPIPHTDPAEQLAWRQAKFVDRDGEAFEKAIADHALNPDFVADTEGLRFRDEIDPVQRQPSWRSTNICDLKHEITAGARPALHYASWLDAGTAAGALARYQTFTAPPMIVRIGAWNHGATQDANPATPRDAPVFPARAEQIDEISRFFRLAHKRPIDRAIQYYTMVADCWRSTTVWPPVGSHAQRWYIQADERLVADPGESGSTVYDVDFDAGTGSLTRWSTQLGGEVDYPDRASADENLLVFTSAPFAQDMEITGTPVATLHVAVDRGDGLFIAYLEDVSPDGHVTYVTEGVLRGIHRGSTFEPRRYQQPGPDRSFAQCDARPILIDVMTEITFPLLPTSWLLRYGHRIRLALAGADVDSFARVPAQGPMRWRVSLGGEEPSFIDIPMCPFDNRDALALTLPTF